MWEFLRQNQFVVGGLTGSLAAWILGQIFTHYKREKRWLGFTTTGRNIVQSGHGKLAISYDGRPVKRLDSYSITFRNIGNKPLSSLPVRIQCLESGTIFEHELSGPDGNAYSVSTNGPHELEISVDLLNVGEAFSVGLTVADASGEGGVKPIVRAPALELRDIGSQTNSSELLALLSAAAFTVTFGFDSKGLPTIGVLRGTDKSDRR